MELLIDDANLSKIDEIIEFYPIDGVTTNPTILSKNGVEPFTILKQIRNRIGENGQLHVQVTALDAKGMCDDAHRIVKELGKTTYVKIPVVKEGLKAMKQLHQEGILITATAIYTPMQAYLAAKVGANYVAPYVNRIDNLGANGIETTKAIHDILVNHKLSTKVLAASFKNSQQVLELCRYGIGAATVGSDVVLGFLKNDSVDKAIVNFTQDFEKLCGKGKTMSSI